MSKDLKEISEHLKESALENVIKYVEVYKEEENKIIDIVNNFDGVKAELYCSDISKLTESAKLLGIYSDLTSVYTAPSKDNDWHIHFLKEDPRIKNTRIVTVPDSLSKFKLTSGSNFAAGYIYKNEAEVKKMTRMLEPLTKRGKFLLRPIRTIIESSKEPLPEKTKHYTIYAQADTSLEHWIAKDGNELDTCTVHNGLKKIESAKVFEVTLPYLTRISLDNLSKVLEDEQDNLSIFRATLKGLGKKLIESDDTMDFHQDIVRPAIDTINKKFKRLESIHRLSIGMSVGACTISMIAFQITPDVNFQTIVNTFIGAGAGFVTSENMYGSGIEKLEESPYFLLWKIKSLENKE